MSGGSFDYAYSGTAAFADALEGKLNQRSRQDWSLSLASVQCLRQLVIEARRTAALMKEAEWLCDGDISDESFPERVAKIIHATQQELDGYR